MNRRAFVELIEGDRVQAGDFYCDDGGGNLLEVQPYQVGRAIKSEGWLRPITLAEPGETLLRMKSNTLPMDVEVVHVQSPMTVADPGEQIYKIKKGTWSYHHQDKENRFNGVLEPVSVQAPLSSEERDELEIEISSLKSMVYKWKEAFEKSQEELDNARDWNADWDSEGVKKLKEELKAARNNIEAFRNTVDILKSGHEKELKAAKEKLEYAIASELRYKTKWEERGEYMVQIDLEKDQLKREVKQLKNENEAISGRIKFRESNKLEWVPYVHGVTEIPKGSFVTIMFDGWVELMKPGQSMSSDVKYFIPLPPDPAPEAKPGDEFSEWFHKNFYDDNAGQPFKRNMLEAWNAAKKGMS